MSFEVDNSVVIRLRMKQRLHGLGFRFAAEIFDLLLSDSSLYLKARVGWLSRLHFD